VLLWNAEGGPGSDAFTTDSNPFASFAINVLRQYARAFEDTCLKEPLSRAALKVCEFCSHQEIFILSQKDYRRPEAKLPDKKRVDPEESAAIKAHRLLHAPISLAATADQYVPPDEQEKERRYRTMVLAELGDAPDASHTNKSGKHQVSEVPPPHSRASEVQGTQAAPPAAGSGGGAAIRAVGGGSSGERPAGEVLAELDWGLPGIAGHLRFATQQVCARMEEALSY
jgi:hypothetical protein